MKRLKDTAWIDVHDLMGPMHSDSVEERIHNRRLSTSSQAANVKLLGQGANQDWLGSIPDVLS